MPGWGSSQRPARRAEKAAGGNRPPRRHPRGVLYKGSAVPNKVIHD